MPDMDEERAAQTNDAETEGTNAELAAAAEDDVNEAQFDDSESESTAQNTPSEQEVDGEVKKPQSLDQRSQNAQRRREAERRAKEIEEIKRQAKFEGIKEGLNGKNPYTDTPIVDDVDMQTYLTMREIEQSGGDPIMDFAKYSAQKRREEIKTAEAAEKTKDWYASDRKEFMKAHPELSEENMQELLEDPVFSAFAEKMVGKVSLNDIYESYNNIRGIFDGEAKEKADRMYAKKLSSPSSLGGTGEYTPAKTVASLTDAEFDKAIERAKRGEKPF